ncbi:hypothetical protein A8L34_13330 [Bacillus sp. FJAT-27264]|nr:hypothetical protein A8L34_13330 [Bacillus sp. FJAT-27264]
MCLTLWGQSQGTGEAPVPLSAVACSKRRNNERILKQQASQISGCGLPRGYFIPEEAPQGLLEALNHFLIR